MKILMVPLDERPCNFAYPAMMPKTGDTLVLPPKSYMGQKKRPADTAKLAAWVLSSASSNWGAVRESSLPARAMVTIPFSAVVLTVICDASLASA